jgi:hexosaminidase
MIQSWRGPDSLADAARRGYRGILSWGYYLDLNERAAQHYSVDPMAGAANMTSEQQSHILGGEAAEWTEYITPEIASFRIWPRAAVIAERLWSPRDTTDVPSMYARLAIVSQDLAYTGIPFRAASGQMLERLAGNENLAALKVLASVVEPPKEYAREELRSYDLYTPLNRMVDAVPAESDTARIFGELARRIASGQGTPADFKQAREWLTLWRDNDAILQPQLSQSELTAELAPLSRNLNQAAAIGLLALDAIEKRQPVSASTQQQWLASLKALETPQAILLDKIVPGVETLVDRHAI